MSVLGQDSPAPLVIQERSAGQPRNVDKTFYRTDGIHGMADFIASYPGVDAERGAERGRVS